MSELKPEATEENPSVKKTQSRCPENLRNESSSCSVG